MIAISIHTTSFPFSPRVGSEDRLPFFIPLSADTGEAGLISSRNNPSFLAGQDDAGRGEHLFMVAILPSGGRSLTLSAVLNTPEKPNSGEEGSASLAFDEKSSPLSAVARMSWKLSRLLVRRRMALS
mmetsp:Transcript_31199/g.68148  ORF Transcript_31199/g.68148 Transcript_31199/m.68148 type:complete len:127 (+) Transcript_31199:109-489(+)